MKKLDSMQSKGGRARAALLTPEERRESASRAARARWDGMPKPLRATHAGELKIGDLVLPCAVLEDGTRVLSQTGFESMLGAYRSGVLAERARREPVGAVLPFFMQQMVLKPFISDDLASLLSHPLPYILLKGGRALGIKAQLIPDVCDIWLRARAAKVLNGRQLAIAAKAEILVRGLARVGIVALVDEATGYQRDRERDALAVILEEFIAKELAAWVKTFPDEFYREMYRLRGIHVDEFLHKRPSYFGTLTNDVVYARLAPGVLDELRRVNPSIGGRRANQHHRWLTRDIGHPKLREHLAVVVALMKLAKTFETFVTNLDQVAPRYDRTPFLPHMPAASDEPVAGQ